MLFAKTRKTEYHKSQLYASDTNRVQLPN